jgi:hypothetical protein
MKKNTKENDLSTNFKKIPVVFVLEELIDLNIIKSSKDSKQNGLERYYWLDMPDNSSSKISVLSKETVQESEYGEANGKFGFMVNLNQGKFNSVNSYGFMMNLEREGLLVGKDIQELMKNLLSKYEDSPFEAYPIVDKKDELLNKIKDGVTDKNELLNRLSANITSTEQNIIQSTLPVFEKDGMELPNFGNKNIEKKNKILSSSKPKSK